MARQYGFTQIPTPKARKPNRRRGLGPDRLGFTDIPNPKLQRGPVFGRNEVVKGGVKSRARKRLKALGDVKGVNAKDGITGREARRIKRAFRRDRNPGQRIGNRPNRPTRPRPPADPYRRELDALTRLNFGAEERAIADERSILAQRQANIGSWYDKYQQDVMAARDRYAAFQAGQQAALGTQANTARTMDMQQAEQMNAEAQASAQQRGVTPAQMSPAPAQQAAASRQALNNAYQGTMAAQGASQVGFFDSQAANAGAYKLSAMQQDEARARKVDELARELARDKGAFRTKTRGELEERAHRRTLEAKAFDLDVAETQADIADKKADNRRDAKKDRWERRKDRADLKLDRYEAKTDRWKERHAARIDRAADIADDGRRNFSADSEGKNTGFSGGGSGGSGGSSGGFSGEDGGAFGRGIPDSEREENKRQWSSYVRDLRNGRDPGSRADSTLVKAAAEYLKYGGRVPPKTAALVFKHYGIRLRKQRPRPRSRFEERRPGRQGGQQFSPLS